MPDTEDPKPGGGTRPQGSKRPKAAPQKQEAGARPAEAPAPAAEPLPAGGAVTAVTGALRPVNNVLASRRAFRLRRWLALMLVVMSVVGLMISALALWSDSLVFN